MKKFITLRPVVHGPMLTVHLIDISFKTIRSIELNLYKALG